MTWDLQSVAVDLKGYLNVRNFPCQDNQFDYFIVRSEYQLLVAERKHISSNIHTSTWFHPPKCIQFQ